MITILIFYIYNFSSNKLKYKYINYLNLIAKNKLFFNFE